MAELPTTLRPDGQSEGHIYVAKVATGIRIGEIHSQGETSFVIPDLHFDKVVEVVKSWRTLRSG